MNNQAMNNGQKRWLCNSNRMVTAISEVISESVKKMKIDDWVVKR